MTKSYIGLRVEIASRIIKDDGLLILEVPNVNDLLIKVPAYKKFYYQNAHCSYFNPTTLNNFMREHGFYLTKTIPLQRYSISNHLHWLIKRKPGKFEKLQILDKAYEKLITKTKYYDTIFAIYKKGII